MPTKSNSPPTVPVIDPHHETIRNIDQVTFHRTGTSHLDITCCALMPKSTNGTDWTNDALVTARLRMDISMVKAFAEGLLKQAAMIEGAGGTMN